MEILYQDAQIVACVKPVGLDSEHQLPQALAQAIGGPVLPVHRLDQNVGGVMVYARTRGAAAELSRFIQENRIEKEYMALVHGTPPPEGIWEDLLWKDSAKNKVYVVHRMRGGVKVARLSYTRLSSGELSLVRVHLITGRSHQIRVQFASRGYPLAGDRKYGAADALRAPMLHCCMLTFPHGGRELRLTHLPDWADGCAIDPHT